NTSNVTDMSNMFNGCSALTTIYCKDIWTCAESTDMFKGCTSLKGAVAYDASKTDVTMANPVTGYFTCDIEAYAVEDGTTLTFYYDKLYGTRTGTVYGIGQKREDNNNYPAWAGSYFEYNDRITKVVFDASFKDYRPSTTESWFYNCRKIETIERIDNLNTANVTNMGQLFSGCNALTSLDLSNFNTENVTDMNTMFYNCKALTSLDVSSFNTQNVTDMHWMFRDCSALTSLDLSNFITEKVTNMNFMFGYCYALTTLDISNFNTENVTDMNNMFYNCSALTTICCNDIWTCSSSSNMFLGCSSLVGAVPFNSSKVDVSMANPYTGYFTATIEFEAYAVEDGTTLTFYNDGKRDTRSGTVYTALNEHKWSESEITKVVFDVSFIIYLPTSTASWFQDCSKLETIEGIENLNTENVTDMSNMFNGCSALTKLDVSGFSTDNVTDMSNMFLNCLSLKTIYCKDIWTCDKSTDMFKGCTSLIGAAIYDANRTDVTMANPDTGYFTNGEAYVVEDDATLTFYYDDQRGNRTGTVYDIDQTHSGTNNPVWASSGWGNYNDNITKVVFDASFKKYHPRTTENWFYNCRKITAIEGIENLNTENVTHMGSMFWGCESLTELDVTGFNT
ncbi:MAG: BspA family leucine-rich repeat surface protein, partial [Muribaculaceae bacterium]